MYLGKGKTKNRKSVAKKGYVYLFKIWYNSKPIYKIGVTTRCRKLRLMEVCMSMYDVLGYLPKALVVASKQTMYRYEIENYLHSKYRSDNVEMSDRVSGYTEFYEIINELDLLEEFDKVLKNPEVYIDDLVVKKDVKPKEVNLNDIDPGGVGWI